MNKPKIAFLGIGLMGGPQARRLLQAGYPVTAWNRSRAKAEALEAHGALIADTPRAAVEGADITITMLENGPVVYDVLFGRGTHESLEPGSVVIDMSSIKADEAQEHARRLKSRGIAHLDAPVSGGTGGAEAGALVIMVGGEERWFDRVEPVLSVMGRASFLGPSGAGQLAKLANQIIVGATIGAVAEALALAQKGGADPQRVRDALLGGFAHSRVLELHGQRMVDRDFAPRGRSVTHLKDLDNALAAGRELDASLPFTELTADLYRALISREGDRDHSALLLELERRSGKARRG